jgi:hypothetical protein
VFPLPRLPYLRLRFTLRAEAPAFLPPFHGSLLRGAFGHALRHAACAMGPEQACADCRLRRSCVYTRLFETFLEGEPTPFLRGIPSPPRPYVFEPGFLAGPADREEGRRFAPGDALPFDLLLFGQALDLWAYALLAVERMAPAGLGSRRVPFRLDRVEAQTPEGDFRPIFADGRPQGPEELSPCTPSAAPLPAAGVALRFLTPTRLRTRGRLSEEAGFRPLVFALLRRTLEIAAIHVPGAEVDWALRPLLDAADGVRVVASDLVWQDGERWSNRQQAGVPLGGFVGKIELEGDLAPFAALLRTAEVIHVGKGATFGLGRMVVEAREG